MAGAVAAAITSQAAQELLQWRRERAAHQREQRAMALDRLGNKFGGRPVLGKLTPQDLRDLAAAANTPMVTVPAVLGALAFIGSSPRASAYLQEGIASISRGIGAGVAAAASGTVQGLWEGFVWDPHAERRGLVENVTKTVVWDRGSSEGWLEWAAKAVTPGWS